MNKNIFLASVLGAFISVSAHNASAGFIVEAEPNDSLAAAQNIDGFFSLGANVDIDNAESIPWVSISSGADGVSSYDFYSFSALAGDRGIFDIDYGVFVGGHFDPELFLFDATGAVVAQNDDDLMRQEVSGGSAHFWDSYLTHTFTQDGIYTIGVCQNNCVGFNGRMFGSQVNPLASYELQVSLTSQVVQASAPAGVGLFVIALAGLIARRKFH